MSLADQITELEEDLSFYQGVAGERADAIANLEAERDELEEQLAEAEEFIEYVNKTNPELRVAFEASNKLEGAKE